MTSPPPPPPLTISTYFPCSAKHFAEGTPLRLRGDSSSTWVVKKLRNVGEPIDKMCEAWRLHAGSERIDPQAALRIWEQLPGKSSWAPINSLLSNRGRARRPMRAIIIRRSRRLECVARRDSRAAGQSHSFAIARKSRRALLADAARTEPWKRLLGRGIAYAAARLHRRRVA
jgi:hypothetical protein